jgi:SAM-dependent methyltransferase
MVAARGPAAGPWGEVAARKEWFRRAFGEDYLAVYAHRDAAEARRQVAFVLQRLALEPPQEVLDLACGAGRHAAELRARGFRVTAVDLSPPLLRLAGETLPGCLVRADMRRLPFRQRFALVTSFFSSFGYFEDEEEDRAVLEQVWGVLQPGGWFFLDYLNPERVRRTLVPEDERTVGEMHVRQERWLTPDGRRVEKRITIRDGRGVREYLESVRLYSLAELRTMFDSAGLSIRHAWGSFAGDPVSESAPRLIVAAVRGERGRGALPG